MPIFITLKKLRHCLETLGPNECAEKFGHRARRRLVSIALSDSESLSVRKASLEALIQVGFDYDSLAALDLDKLSVELQDVLFRTAFSTEANQESRTCLLHMLDNELVKRYLLASTWPDLPDTLIEACLDDDTWCRYNKYYGPDVFYKVCIDFFVLKYRENAGAHLTALLRRCDIQRDFGLIGKTINALREFRDQGPVLEEVLIEKLHAVAVGDFRVSARLALAITVLKKDLDPYGKIISLLAEIGGTKALDAMLKKHYSIPLPVDHPTGDRKSAGAEALGIAAGQVDTLFLLDMRKGISQLAKRLQQEGRLSDLEEVELLDRYKKETGTSGDI